MTNPGCIEKEWRRLGKRVGRGAIAAFYTTIFTTVATTIFTPTALAQNITFDGTLGPAGPVPTAAVIINSAGYPTRTTQYQIHQQDGQTVGNNLFHSFGRFNLNANEAAFFLSDASIRNILARVTGGAASSIDGFITTRNSINSNQNTSVNLFLINPSGILFGANAQLNNIGTASRGSFFATTVDAIQFPGGRQFSATNPAGSDLLKIVGDPSGFLASQRSIPPISVTSQSSSVRLPSLSVRPNQSLVLLGGEIQLDGTTTLTQRAVLGASSGRIELGGVSGAAEIGLTVNGNLWRLNFPSQVPRADVSLKQFSVQVINNGGGDIAIHARNLTVSNSQIVAGIRSGQGSKDSQAGSILLDATDTISITKQSQVANTMDGIGRGGNLDIQTRQLIVQNSQVKSDLFGEGNAGNLTVDAKESIDLSGDYIRGTQQGPGGLFTQVNSTGKGQGGNMTVITPLLRVREGGKVQAATFGQGNAGNVLIQAQDVEVIDTPEIANRFPAAINAGATLTLDPAIDAQGLLKGNGGNLTIETDRLFLRGGEVTVDNFGVGSAGNLFITASDSVQLSDRSKITAETRSGQGGDINLTVGSLLLLRTNSQISTTAGTAQAGGDGGNIRINAKFIVAIPSENGDITANAFTGKGGSIDITAQSIFGIQPRAFLTPLSDITASSQFGINGTITINTLDIDPNRGLVALPTSLSDPAQQIAQTCVPPIGKTASSFVITGRGGIPLSPDEPLDSLPVMARWVPLPEEIMIKANNEPMNQDDHEVSPAKIQNPKSKIQNLPIEATGWIVHPNGQVELVAEIPQPQPHDDSHLNPYTQATHGWLMPLVCQGVQ